MGGDGGTLNNSRHDHVRMRRELGGAVGASKTAALTAKERTSVTLCSASRQPLAMPIVVDRLGQLFRKDALIACMLEQAPAFAHVKSLARDTAALKGPPKACAVTREPVTTHGRFVVGWECGCVVSSRAVAEVRSKAKGLVGSTEKACVACGEETAVVMLGMTGEERESLRETLLADQAKIAMAKKAGKSKKRRKVKEEPHPGSGDKASGVDADTARDVEATNLSTERRPTKAPKLHSDSDVYKSLFVPAKDLTHAKN